MRPVLLALICLLLSSCAAAVSSEPQIYNVGELEVRLYKDQGRMAQDLPPLLSAVGGFGAGSQVKVLGYFDRQNKRIYSIDDLRVLLHELKHYLEPGWNHDIGCAQLTTLDEQAASPCKQQQLAGTTPEPQRVAVRANPLPADGSAGF
jgi:hypothetical protein